MIKGALVYFALLRARPLILLVGNPCSRFQDATTSASRERETLIELAFLPISVTVLALMGPLALGRKPARS
jgi:hypothetical protein